MTNLYVSDDGWDTGDMTLPGEGHWQPRTTHLIKEVQHIQSLLLDGEKTVVSS